jgi:UTP--glucose-1-phosphate uridylyltransferase
MGVLASQEKGAGGEIQLTDAMSRMIGEQPFHGVTFAGTRYDCGDKAGFLHANLAMALAREDLADEVELFASELLAARQPRRAA